MRNMSFMLTKQQMYDRSKTVTRRCGWWFLNVNDIVMSCEKCQGLKKGESIIRMYPIIIISTYGEHLDEITKSDCIKEGFPDLAPKGFVDMFVKEMRVPPYEIVNRIQFKEYNA